MPPSKQRHPEPFGSGCRLLSLLSACALGKFFRYSFSIDALRKNLIFYRLLFNRICKMYQNSIAIEANKPNAAATYWLSS